MQDKVMELIEEFEARLKSLKEEYNDEGFTLELGDEYWVVDGSGEPIIQGWDGYPYDKIALENNAIFKTKEEAEFEAERLKVLRGLEKLGRPFKPHEDNYVIAFSHNAGLKVVGYVTTVTSYGNYYFDSEEEAREAIEKIGEDRIKKYLFGIELHGEPNE